MRFIRLISIISILFLVAFKANATEYYIDFDTGSDAANGTNTSTPWKHSPDDVNATDVSGSTVLTGGDKVVLKGGVQYDGQFNLYWSGTGDADSARIIYDGNSDGSWGTGRAIVDGGDTRKYGFGTTSARSYITFNNFEIRNVPYTEVNSIYPDAGIGIGNGTTDSVGIIVRNCYIWGIAHWENNDDYLQYGACISINRGYNCLIDNCELTKGSRWAVRLYGGINNTILNTEIYEYFQWAIDITSAGWQQPNNTVISGCTLHDIYQYDCKYNTLGDPGEGYWEGTDCVSPDNPHTDFIFVRDSGEEMPPLNTVIERTLFYNNRDFGSHYDGTAFIYFSDSQNSIVRNCIFINPHSSRAIHDQDDSDNTQVFNCTFFGRTSSPGTTLYFESATSATYKNNIVISSNINLHFGSIGATSVFDSDHNLFVPLGNNLAAINTTPTATYYEDLAEWQAAYGEDANSVSVSAVSGVNFVDTSGFPTSCSTMDLKLLSNSPAVNAGTTITGVTIDFDGNPRDASPDIGAYEYTGDDTTPPVITNTTAASHPCTSSVSMTLTTNEAATCRYDTSDMDYDSMGNTFSTTGGTSHAQSITVSCDNSYGPYYCRCEDGSGNKNTSSTGVSFSVEAQQQSGANIITIDGLAIELGEAVLAIGQ